MLFLNILNGAAVQLSRLERRANNDLAVAKFFVCKNDQLFDISWFKTLAKFFLSKNLVEQ